MNTILAKRENRRRNDRQTMPLRGVIFDMDGTLTVQAIDFAAMRARLGIPAGDILATIKTWSPQRRTKALAVIEEIETVARDKMQIQPGAVDLLRFLETRGLRSGLITRNTMRTVQALQRTLGLEFSAVVTRDFEAVKPAPAPALHICRQWRVTPAQALMVGDYRDDILCGRAAGMRTCLLLNERNREYAALPDYAVTDLFQLQSLIERLLAEK